jgi:hypothetical protein
MIAPEFINNFKDNNIYNIIKILKGASNILNYNNLNNKIVY